MNDQGLEFKVLDNEFIYVRCCANIFNFIVSEGLNEVDESIIKIRNIVKFVRSSPNRVMYFKKCMDKLKVESKIRVFV